MIAALLKLNEPEGFYISLTYSNFIGSKLGWWLMYIIPFIELVIGFSLLIGFRRRLTTYSAIVVLIIFSIYLIFNSFLGSGICGCFGNFDLEWPLGLDLLRNAILILFIIPNLSAIEKTKFNNGLKYLIGIIITSLIIISAMMLNADFNFN